MVARFHTLCLFLLLCGVLCAHVAWATEDEDVAAELAAEREAEEAAAAEVERAAEEDDIDEADAHDSEADAARFDPDDPNVFPLTDMPPSAKDAEFGYAFAGGLGDGKVVTLGEKVRALVAFANEGRVRYHVWGVMGSLNMPRKFGDYVQNFTYGTVNETVVPGGELSFEYDFVPNERLDVRDFTLALSVFYEAQGPTGNVIRAHSTTFLNQTVTAVSGPQAVNNATFMALFTVVIAGAVGLAWYLKKMSDDSKRVSGEVGTGNSDGKEWLEEHQSMLGGSARAKAKSR